MADLFDTRSAGDFAVGAYDGYFEGYQPGSTYNYARDAGLRYDNSVVMAAVGFLSRVWTEADFQVSTPQTTGARTHQNPIHDHELTNLVSHPNEYYDGSTLWLGTLLSYVSNGNAYWYKLRSKGGMLAGFLYLPHFSVEPDSSKNNKDGTKLITGYTYASPQAGNIWIPKDDIVHMRWGIDPLNMMKGLSPIGACLREIVTDNEASSYAASILRNMGVPGALLSPKNVVPRQESVSQRERLKSLWDRTFRGEGRGSVMVAPFPIELLSVALNPENLMLDKMTQHPVSRICAAIGLDPMVLGYPSSSKTYSNYKEAFEAAYRTCIIPMKESISAQLTYQLLRKDYMDEKNVVSWNYTDVWALQRDEDATWDRVVNAWDKGAITRAQLKDILGLEIDPAKDNVYKEDISLKVEEAKAKAAAANKPADPGKKPDQKTNSDTTYTLYAEIGDNSEQDASGY